MIRLLSFLACLIAANTVTAQEPITGEELRQRLSGNTAIGQWFDDTYRQWFAEDGTTIYAPKGKRSSRGQWRVSTDGQNYQSQWGNGTWETYGVIEDNGQLFWTTSEGDRNKFELVEGQKLTW